MHKKCFCFSIILIIINFFSTAQEIGFPIIQNYTTKEYNNSPQVFSIIQDKRGIMYFGVSGEILEYDGVSWRNIPNEKHASAYDLAMDKNGRIYVAANEDFGYLDTDKKGNTIYKSLTYLIVDTTFKLSAVWSVKFTSQSTFFQSLDALIEYNVSSEKIKIYKSNPGERFSFVFIYHDTYYIKSNTRGLMKIENSELKQIPQTDFFNDIKSIVSLPFDSSKLLIPNGDEGLILCQPNGKMNPVKFNLSEPEFFADNRIYSASPYQKDYFVLGSLKKGAVLINKPGRVLQRYNELNLLNNNQILEVFPDTSQNIWLGTNNGVSKTENSLDLSYWDKNSGLRSTVYSVIRYNNVVYFSTGVSICYIDKNNQIKEVENIPTGQNWCLLKTKNTKSLFAGTSYGIYEIKGDQAVEIYKGGLASKLYQSVKDTNRILSTDYDFLISLKYENGRWVSEGKWEGIEDDIRGIIEDENGEIWLGTFRNGVIRITPDSKDITKPLKVRYYNDKDGIISLKEVLPFNYKNKIIWSTENGLYIHNTLTDSFIPFCELGDLFCKGIRTVYILKEMPDSKIWISPSDNKKADIGYLKPNTKGGYDWVYAPFRRIPEMYINAFYIEPSGIAWIGGSEGIYRYDMRKDTKNYTQQFNCLIRRITTGTDSLIYAGNTSIIEVSDFDPPTELNYNSNSVKFEFAAPFFDHEEKTMYSYKLEGFDKEWSKWSRRSEKEYTNLHEGSYTFKVRARNIYDIESEISTYQITILPPFYRTWWAYCIYIIMLSVIVILIVKLYTKYLRKQREHLKQLVEERTIEIIHQKEEITAALHSLKDAQGRLIQSEKMASLGILAAGIAHEINNPLNFIQGGVTGLKQYFDANPVCPGSNIEFFIKGISEGIDRAEEIVSSLYHFSQSDINRTETIDIHNIIDNCLLMLMFETKNRIEIVKNYTNIPYMLIGNEANLHQAFLNILTNAVQSIKDKGKIMIKTEIESKLLKVIFSDTGCGIREEDLPKILDPFFTTKDPGKGTGLGLSITYNIIKEHQGSIEYHSKWGEGTTATLRFPIKNLN